MNVQPPSSTPDRHALSRAIALATRQHGVVHRAQLVALGIGASTIDRWLAAGILGRLHRCVYVVGHRAPTRRGALLAAVFACADRDPVRRPGRSAAGRRSAAGLLGLTDPFVGTPEVLTERRCAPTGVTVSRVRALAPRDVVIVDGVPTTTWARTLVDLGAVLDIYPLARVLERSVVRELYDHPVLVDTMERADGHNGLGPLRRAIALGHHLDPQTCESELEERFLRLVREATPPLPVVPRTQQWVTLRGGETFRVDVLVPELRIAIELDSRWHDPSGARFRDAARDRALTDAGYLTHRFRWGDVVGRPGWVLWTMRALIDRRLAGGVAIGRR